jgi:hypothetical protein
MSALSMEKNGGVSVSKRSKHIKAKYFLVKDYYEAKEIDLKYCPTESMWADVLTRPLQRHKFCDMHAFLQNCPCDYDDDAERQSDLTMTIKLKLMPHRGSVLVHKQNRAWIQQQSRHQEVPAQNVCLTFKFKLTKNTSFLVAHAEELLRGETNDFRPYNFLAQ